MTGLTPSTGGAVYVLGIQDGGRPEAGPKTKNAPTKVGAQFFKVISILFGNGFVKPKREIFTRFAKWRAFNFLRLPGEANLRHLLVTHNS